MDKSGHPTEQRGRPSGPTPSMLDPPTGATGRASRSTSKAHKNRWQKKSDGNEIFVTFQTKADDKADRPPTGWNKTQLQLAAPNEQGRNYIKVELGWKDQLFEDTEQTKGEIYISVGFLLLIAGSQEKNITIEAEEKFLGGWRKYWDKDGNWAPNKPGVVLARDADGSLRAPRCKERTRNVWKMFIEDVVKSIKGGGGKPPRHRDINLKHDLFIVPRLRDARLWPQAKDLEVLVTAVNKMGEEARSKTTGMHLPPAPRWTLKVAQKAPDNYFLMSSDPFNMYYTYIHNEDWSNYMESLENPKKDSAVRAFPTGANITTLSSINEKISQYDNKVQTDKNLASALEHGDKTLLDTWNEETPVEDFGTSQKRLNFITERFSFIKNVIKKGICQSDEYGTRLIVDLSTKKIAAAKGKRDEVFDQLAVMAGHSASDLADSFKWDDHMLVFSPAEWLHLSAFSWGGLAEPNVENAFTSSQAPENLIFGTSETNSLMTRYEYAWQNLFAFEAKLAVAQDDINHGNPINEKEILSGLQSVTNPKTNGTAIEVENTTGDQTIDKEDDDEEEEESLEAFPQLPNKPVQGALFIRCNRPEHPLQFDVCETVANKKAYSIKTIDIWPKGGEWKKAIQDKKDEGLTRSASTDHIHPADKVANTNQEITQGNTPVTFETMRSLLKKSFFLAYSVEYNVHLFGKSRVLGTADPKETFVFYPFMRPFYHRAEHWLDGLVFRGLVERALHSMK